MASNNCKKTHICKMLNKINTKKIKMRHVLELQIKNNLISIIVRANTKLIYIKNMRMKKI